MYLRGEQENPVCAMCFSNYSVVSQSIELQSKKVLLVCSLSAGWPQHLCHRPLPEKPSVSVMLRLAKADN